jgi:DNA polymerase IV
MRTLMHADLDAFFVSVEQVDNPSLRGLPVIVGGRPDSRGVVATASYEARRSGVHSGMPLRTAQRLCPRAVFLDGNFARYREASHRFMDILAGFSPFLEPGGLDEAYLETTGFESLHGTQRHMAQAIKDQVKGELGLNVTIGIAACKVVAKVASKKAKPDGLLEVPPGSEAAFLAPLPLGDLPGAGRKTSQVLAAFGIATIGDLARAPDGLLKDRLGSYGLWLRELARGCDDRPVEAPGSAKSISRETTFVEDTRDTAYLEGTLRYLTEAVGERLRRHGMKARCVSLKLRYADFTTLSRQATLPTPADGNEIIYATGLKLLRGALGPSRLPVRLLGMGVSEFQEKGQQFSLFDQAAAREAKLDEAIDRIRRKYGFTAIQTGRTLALKGVH